MQKIKKTIIYSKKGMSTIELMIGTMILLLLFCFIFDIAILTWQFQSLSITNTYLARTAGIQGGILSSAPNGYPGGPASYVNSSQMDRKIEKSLSGAGIIDYEATYPKTKVNYGEQLETQIRLVYAFTLTSNFFPNNTYKPYNGEPRRVSPLRGTLTSNRTAFSEFHYRYDEFKGE